MNDEETRAALWREQQRRRARFQAGLQRSLAGSPAARAALMASWQPLIDKLAEAQQPPEPAELELDPLGISDQVNVGQ